VIIGVHAIIFANDAARVRAFLHDVLELESVDAGGGWLIFALPPAELAAHPTDGQPHHQLYLMCDDIRATVADLTAKGVEFTREITEEGFGLMTANAEQRQRSGCHTSRWRRSSRRPSGRANSARRYCSARAKARRDGAA
jgi:predicted enzyme related to lactoylglutathione lyase